MNTDIRISVSFKGHRKLKKLRRAIGDRAAEYLLNLWISTATDAPKGVLAGWTDEDVADAADWQGEPSDFTAALINCAFLERDADGSYMLHDWCQWQGWACGAEERSDKAKAAASARWEKHNAGSNAPILSYPSPTDKQLPPQPPAGGSEEGKGGNGQPPDPPLPTVADPPPVPPKQKRTKELPPESEKFLTFWASYPNKQGRAKAWEKWSEWNLDSQADAIMTALNGFKRSEGWLKDNGQFIPHGSTWINQRRWLDMAEVAAPRQPVQRDGAAPRPMPNSRELAERLAQERYDADMRQNQPENEQEGG